MNCRWVIWSSIESEHPERRSSGLSTTQWQAASNLKAAFRWQACVCSFEFPSLVSECRSDQSTLRSLGSCTSLDHDAFDNWWECDWVRDTHLASRSRRSLSSLCASTPAHPASQSATESSDRLTCSQQIKSLSTCRSMRLQGSIFYPKMFLLSAQSSAGAQWRDLIAKSPESAWRFQCLSCRPIHFSWDIQVCSACPAPTLSSTHHKPVETLAPFSKAL